MEIKIIPVVNAIIMKDGKVLLGRRNPEAKYYPHYWTFPGGKVDPGERLEDALKREVREETGLEIGVVRLIRYEEGFHDDHHHIFFDFECNPVGGEITPCEELVEIKWFAPGDIKKLKLTEDNREFIESKLDF